MFTKLNQALAERKRRHALKSIRRELEKYGYPLDRISDAQVEAALTQSDLGIANIELNAKTIWLALSRLSKPTHQRPTSYKKAA